MSIAIFRISSLLGLLHVHWIVDVYKSKFCWNGSSFHNQTKKNSMSQKNVVERSHVLCLPRTCWASSYGRCVCWYGNRLLNQYFVATRVDVCNEWLIDWFSTRDGFWLFVVSLHASSVLLDYPILTLWWRVADPVSQHPKSSARIQYVKCRYQQKILLYKSYLAE